MRLIAYQKQVEERAVLGQQENKLTLCYYENPAAKQEIKFWESLIEDKIQSKSYIKDIWSYHLKDGKENEIVVCVPIDRTLIFGRINANQLETIGKIIRLMELGKWR